MYAADFTAGVFAQSGRPGRLRFYWVAQTILSVWVLVAGFAGWIGLVYLLRTRRRPARASARRRMLVLGWVLVFGYAALNLVVVLAWRL